MGSRQQKYGVEKNKAIPAFYNLYCNELLKLPTEGYIMFLDDDDCFTSDTSLENIMKHITSSDDMLFWSFQLTPSYIAYPRNKHNIRAGAVANSGYVFHSKFKLLSTYEQGQEGDFAFVNKLLKAHNFNQNLTRLFSPKPKTNITGHLGAELS